MALLYFVLLYTLVIINIYRLLQALKYSAKNFQMSTKVQSITVVKVVQVVSQDSCLDGVTVEKTHTWSTGYIGKLLLDQSWLTKPTSDWTLDLGFCSQVSEFKVREVKSTNICINLQL